MGVLALVGTRKGLFLLRADDGRNSWDVEGPLLDGWGVHHAILDERDGTFYAAANHLVYGPTVQRSTDGGKTWRRSRQIGLPEESGLTVDATWHVEPGRPEEPGTLYLGGDPAFLSRSDDRARPGRRTAEFSSTRRAVAGFRPAAVSCCTGSSSTPATANACTSQYRAAAPFAADDGGATWAPKNKDVEFDLTPDPYPEVGQCVHKLLLHPARPDRLWQQNHCGVYRSDDRGDTWERLDGNGLPSSFGFTIMLDPTRPRRGRRGPGEGLRVSLHRRRAGRLSHARRRGRRGSRMIDGLPERAWAAVLREASAFDSESLYFGTQSGSFFALTNGDRWVEGVRHLPPILSVEVTAWSG